jgi:hypothetical protein
MSKPITEIGAAFGVPEPASPWIRISSMSVFLNGSTSNVGSVSELRSSISGSPDSSVSALLSGASPASSAGASMVYSAGVVSEGVSACASAAGASSSVATRQIQKEAPAE